MPKKQFKAESKRLLDLMINSIYTHKEIFIREIISNASDAIDKLSYLSLTDNSVGMSRSDFRIRIYADKEARVITISDNGIGMTAAELESNLGVIARSGTLEFKNTISESSGDDDMNIIGQFGVGFYSAFMVADSVDVITRAFGQEAANRWSSSGVDGYTVSACDKDTVGTDVIIRLKPDTEDELYSEFLSARKLEELVKKYSDYVRWPIIMDVERSERRETGETDSGGNPKFAYVTVSEEKTVNSMIPIWHRSKSEASDDECIAFYKEKFYDATNPVALVRVNAEGAVSYRALLFVPEKAPYDFYTQDYESGLSLYSNGVMIMERCTQLLPECFRFVRGIVDSPDLSLNISREMLQHDRQLNIIASNIEKRIKSELKKLMTEKPEKYRDFWNSFGIQLKYGLVQNYGEKQELLADLLVFLSSRSDDELTSLADYVSRMPEEQKSIYYACAETIKHAQALPQVEVLKAKGYEIFWFTEQVDEFVASSLIQYEEKPFVNISSGDLGLETEDERENLKKLEDSQRDMLDFIKESLDGAVEQVRLTSALGSRAAALGTEGGISIGMEQYFESMPGAETGIIKARRILELNSEHRIFDIMCNAYENDRERVADISKVLFTGAQLVAGIKPDDPAGYSELVLKLL